jgi:hypothetical protein
MATIIVIQETRSGTASRATHWRTILALTVCTGLPLGLFGLVNLGADALGHLPLFFSPFGLPGWAGAVLHLVQLALLGAAFWALTRRGEGGSARFWLVGLTLAYILLPYITPPLDSLQLTAVCSLLFLLALGTVTRVGAASSRAGWLMSPMVFVIGVSAAMGLAISLAFAPPFALVQAQQAPAA